MRFFLLVCTIIAVCFISRILPAQMMNTPGIDAAKSEAEAQINRMMQEQRQKIEDLKKQAADKAVNKAANPHGDQVEACRQSMQKCSEAMQAAPLCGKPGIYPVMPTNGKQPVCPDGSAPNMVALNQAAQSCQMPPNCEQVMRNAMTTNRAGGLMQGYGGSFLNDLFYGVPSLPYFPVFP